MTTINCPECGSPNVYTTLGERVCRRCGNRWARATATLIPPAKCRHCGNGWQPRTPDPQVCPKCQRKGWRVGAKP